MDQQNTDSAQKAMKFLRENRLGVLTTVSPENTPQSALVYYVFDENFRLFILTIKESQKIANISKNNKVSFVVANEVPPIEIQIEGSAGIVENADKETVLVNQYMEVANKNPETFNWPPVIQLPSTRGFSFIEITITKFKYSDFSGPKHLIIEGTPKDWQVH